MKLTKQQEDFIKEVESSKSSIQLEAVAGSGKTTTLTLAAQGVSESARAFAFNKSIAAELSERFPSNIDCRTFHSAGMKECFSRMRTRVNAKKLNEICDKHGLSDPQIFYPLTRVIGLAKALGYKTHLPAPSLEEIIENADWDFPLEFESSAVQWCEKVFNESLANTSTLDFDDMCYLPVYHQWIPERFPVIFVDEAQDLSPVQREFALNSFRERAIVVGDSKQAIYQFRGADEDSMQRFSEATQPIHLPLSTTFRCSRRVTEEASKYTNIECLPNAPEGSVKHEDEAWYNKHQPHFDGRVLILCRWNAPLFKTAVDYLLEEKPFRFLGAFPKRLHGFVNRFHASDVPTLERRIRKELEKARDRMTAARFLDFQDKANAVLHLCKVSKTMRTLRQRINDIGKYSKRRPDLEPVLSTIHGAKGLEADFVIFLNSEQVTEDNLSYVAVTRAKQSLVYIN